MNKLKLIILFNLILILSSCSTLKDGFKNQKKNSTDEFLVEKKSPLIMPPNYNELPNPKNSKPEDQENEFKLLITKNKNEKKTHNSLKGSLEDSLLKKIKNN